ncbi:hypothetical protein GW17_00015320 [Ensete ventricosum]|nr:hypothetical protein GW17_00015320 [Ensete ventricosum]
MTVTPHHRVRPWVRGHHSSTCGVRRCLCSFGLLHRIPFVLMHNNNRSNCVTANSHHHRGNQIKSPPSQGIALSHLLLVRLARATHSDAKVIFLEGACCVVIWNLLQSSDPATARILSGPFDASDCNAALGRWLLLQLWLRREQMRLASFLQCGCGAPRPEETPQAIRTGTDPRDRSRRRRSRGNDASTPWRPSLAAISENGAPTRAAAGALDGKKTADGAEKHNAVVSRRVLPRDHSDHYR